ncbi:sulfotransferase 2A8-like [Ostrea edulis]|uniref:sulfotransferase 2A8-like n=1 Tax=Ostrea edulis TaxID=37623 RepID=UPI0024AF1C76|nr:sulfotransferase 2A8-like [Ostrea edulis]
MATKEKLRVDGLVLPGFSPLLADARKRFLDIENLPMRKDDVLLSSYPKLSNHWLNEIVPRLLNSMLHFDHRLIYTFLEFMPDLMDLQVMPSPRVMTSHLPYRCLPKEHITNRGKIIRIIRNSKDVEVSAFHHFNIDPTVKDYVCPEWSEFLDDFLHRQICYGRWFDIELEWEQAALVNPENILTLYYKELKTNGLQTIRCLADFLGIPNNSKFLQAVYEKGSFDEVQKRRMGTDDEYIYKKGMVDDWKSHITVAQNEKIDHVFNERMGDSKLRIRMNTSGKQ